MPVSSSTAAAEAPARGRRLLWAGALAAAVLLTGLVAPASAAHAETSDEVVIQRILADTNAARASAGKAPLVRNAALDAVAGAWSRAQAGQATMSHNPSFSAQYPAGWTRAGENVAYGYSYTGVVPAWVASSGHYANLIGDFTDIGIGVSYDSSGRPFYTQNFAKYASTAAQLVPSGMGTGAVAVRGSSGELLPGATIELRKDSCSGAAVWRTTTTAAPNAYGAFGISLPAGAYCVVTLGAPALYEVTANQMITVQARSGNWFTVWLPAPVNGAVAAKNAQGAGVDGVTVLTTAGSCASRGSGVWQNTTATGRWSSGAYGITLKRGTYCSTVIAAPAGWVIPAPVETVVDGSGPAWVTAWMARG